MRTPTRPLRMVSVVLLVAAVILGLHWFLTGYRTFTQTRGYDHYSLELPAFMLCTMNHAYPQAQAVNGVRFVGFLSDGSSIALKVSIGNQHPSESPTMRAEKDLHAGDHLLERTMDVVSDAPCVVQTTASAHVVYKRAFFEHNNRAWNFYVRGESNHRDQIETIFDRALDTFEFLP